jgi:hypothetical protein
MVPYTFHLSKQLYFANYSIINWGKKMLFFYPSRAVPSWLVPSGSIAGLEL